MLSQSKALPTTSQPTPDDFLPYFERARDQGDHLICALLSSQLSGTVQSAQIAREMCGYEHIYIIDSTLATVALRAMLDLGEQLRSQGMSAPDIAAQIEAAKSRMRVFGIVDTLEYLHKGGRMSTSVAVVGSLLRVKPIITLKDGVLGLVGKGVGTKGSLAGMLKQVGDDIHPDPRLPIYYGYSGDDTLCRQFVPLMEEKFGPHGQEIRSSAVSLHPPWPQRRGGGLSGAGQVTCLPLSGLYFTDPFGGCTDVRPQIFFCRILVSLLTASPYNDNI